MLKGPSAVALDAVGALHVADSSNNRIRKIDSSGTISTEVGTGVAGFSGDGGAPTAARLNRPRDVAFDRFGRLTIDDPYNGRVRQLGTLWALP
jgi:sugar lactone lactonase YvrE